MALPWACSTSTARLSRALLKQIRKAASGWLPCSSIITVDIQDEGEEPMQTTTPGAATSSHLPIRQDWLERRREEIIEPDLPIVDPHHHLVDRPETGRYLLPALLGDLGTGHNITATVYLEWLSMYRGDAPAELRPVGEIEFANGVAAMS